MPKTYSDGCKLLLAIKSKAALGKEWSRADESDVKQFLDEGGNLAVLAACCAVVSGQLIRFQNASDVILASIQRDDFQPYVELSIYEALVCFEGGLLQAHASVIIGFIDSSLRRRSINLDNTISLLARFAKTDNKKAVSLIHLLSQDSDQDIRERASAILRELGGH